MINKLRVKFAKVKNLIEKSYIQFDRKYFINKLSGMGEEMESFIF
jgi:hypothetical protein